VRLCRAGPCCASLLQHPRSFAGCPGHIDPAHIKFWCSHAVCRHCSVARGPTQASSLCWLPGAEPAPQQAASGRYSRRARRAGERNTEHYFVATQDRGLRSALGLRPGGASVFVSVNGMHLEPPSDAQKAQSGQARRQPAALTLNLFYTP
jgi:hypothetical protein